MSGSFSAGAGECAPELSAALARLDGLVDWERRARSDASGRLMRQSLAPARDLLDRLGSPDRSMTLILVAGTKGKGSVASMLAMALGGLDLRVGLYSSPHVERINERIRLGGVKIDDQQLAQALQAAMDARDEAENTQSAGADATWFDVLTAAGLWAMQRAGMRFACLECGLGGRLDSTNAVQPVLSIVTQVELEHTAILGSTRAAIAREKAAVGRPGAPLVSGVGSREDEAGCAVAQLADEIGARLVSVDLGDSGSIEASNARLARVALDELGFCLGQAEIQAACLDEAAILAARLPGRLELLKAGAVQVVLDGAHVTSSLERVLADLAQVHSLNGAPQVVFGAGADKDTAGMLKLLIGRADRVFCTSPGPGPYVSPRELERQAMGLGLEAEAFDDPERALQEALQHCGEHQWVLITGSLHLVGRLRGLLKNT